MHVLLVNLITFVIIPLIMEGGIYIHIAYCRSKCLYCDFYSGGLKIADWEKYTQAITNESIFRKSELNFAPVSLYIGGGTPSLMPMEYLGSLVDSINNFTVNTWHEFTLEVNPEDVTKTNCDFWESIGVNRISLGLQTLNDNILKKIGRNHDSITALKALNLLTSKFENVSVDIIFGLPGQNLDEYRKTIEKVIDFHPTHISSYSLMLEPGTVMTFLEQKGKLTLPTEEEWLSMFKLTTDLLKGAGYKRYEISNYAIPGFESKHNSNYWTDKPYLGLGPGAHSFDGFFIRRANPNDLKGYITRFVNNSNDYKPFYNEEHLSKEERKEEIIMTSLRTCKGLNIKKIGEKFGDECKRKLLHQSASFIEKGLMKESSDYLFFTDEGFLISDAIISELI